MAKPTRKTSRISFDNACHLLANIEEEADRALTLCDQTFAKPNDVDPNGELRPMLLSIKAQAKLAYDAAESAMEARHG